MNIKPLVKVSLYLMVTLPVVASAAAPSFAGEFANNHPRRAEVLGRDNKAQSRINRNLGHLGGHAGQLTREDQSIRRQEQRDARMNGGHITKAEQNHLNKEENHLNRQISRDKR